MIEDILPRKTVIADGVLTEVAFDFEVVNADYIKVYLNGVLQNSGWSLSDNKIIFTSAPSANTTITVIRDLPVNYISPIKSRGALTSDKIDEHLSEMTAKVQTLSEKISRVPTYPVDTLLTGEQITEDFLEKFQKSSDNLASISGAKDEVVTAKVDGIKALNDETARLTAQVANAIDGKVDIAENAATSAENFAETSKQWAVKMDGKVANEDFSAKYYANQAQISASLTKLDDKLTNCLLNVPQDIKLELSNGTLTLKAGSKVYVPNGVGRFDEVIIPSDISRTIVWHSPGFITCESNNYIDWAHIDYCFSGDAAPDSPVNGSLWYDTGNNRIWRYNGSKWTAKKSLPIAILNASTTVSKQSIDQVFNGFGYIGGTVFALPGVEGLIPNGRNIDGSLNNIKLTTTSVFTYTPTTGTHDVLLTLTSDRFYWNSSARYDTENNYNINDAVIIPQLILGYANVVSGKITSFNSKLPIKIADDQEVVHLSQEETISGIKNFETSINTKPKSLSVPNLNGYDLDGNKVGDILIGKSSNGNFYSILRINKQDGSFGAQVGLKRDSSDNIYLEGITPSATDNSTKLATTAWVKGRHQVVSTLPARPDTNTFYYIPED